jgi:hypothetical protein
MKMSQVAEKYLSAFHGGEEIPGGLSYQKALGQCKLDGSMESLKRIDMLLDQLREKQRLEFDAFLKNPGSQNFLYVLCFYVGTTVAKNSGATIQWLAYAEAVAQEPSLSNVWPRAFETSVICNLLKPAGNVKQFLPLVPIVVRLFEGPEEKSVWFSASGFL